MKRVKSIISLLIFLLIFLFFNFCKKARVDNLNYTLTKDTIQLSNLREINELELFAVKEIDDSIYIVTKHFNSLNLYFYKYFNDSLIFERTSKLPKTEFDSCNKFGRLSSMDIINKDSLLLFQKHKISILNLKDERIDFTFIHSLNDSNYYFNTYPQPISWNYYNNTILSITLRFDDKKTKKFPYDTEFSTEINPYNSKINIVPLKYPKDIFQTSLIFTLFHDPYITTSENYYVGSFGITPDIFTLNKKTKEIKKIKIKHNKILPIEPFDSLRRPDYEYLLKHMTKSINYFQIIYDKYNDVYYRFYKLNLKSEKKEDGTLNVFKDKISCISVISNDFKLIGDVEFKESFYNFGWFPTSKGLIQLGRTKIPNIYIIRKLNIKLK